MGFINKLVVGFILILFIISCKENEFLNNKREKQFYSLINDLLIDSIYSPDLIIKEVMMFDSYNYDKSGPPPPPFGHFIFPKITCDDLVMLADSNIIESNDIPFYTEQLFPKSQFRLDPNNVNVKTISRDTLFQALHMYKVSQFWEYLKHKYQAESFLAISFPLFSKDNNTIIMTIDFLCGSLCGEGVTYVFKKVKDRWYIIYRAEGWVS